MRCSRFRCLPLSMFVWLMSKCCSISAIKDWRVGMYLVGGRLLKKSEFLSRLVGSLRFQTSVRWCLDDSYESLFLSAVFLDVMESRLGKLDNKESPVSNLVEVISALWSTRLVHLIEMVTAIFVTVCSNLKTGLNQTCKNWGKLFY